MREAAISYQETVQERKNVARSIHNKKGGSSTMKLGKKPMSWQEIRAQHGPVHTYSVEDFLTYQQFQDLPDDLKVEWVNRVCDKYDITIKHVSRYLFELEDKALSDYLGQNKLLLKCSPGKRRGKTKILEFQSDIADWKRRESLAVQIDAAEKEVLMNSFITYEQYRELSDDRKIEYLNNLIEKYQICVSMISKILFQKSEYTLTAYFNTKHRQNEIKKLKFKNTAIYTENNKRFKDLVDEWRDSMTKKPEEVEEPVAEPVVEFVPKSAASEIESFLNDIFGKKEEPEETKEKIDVNGESYELGPEVASNPNDIQAEVPDGYCTVSTINIPEAEIAGSWKDPFAEEPEKDLSKELEYHDISYTSSYIRDGLDMDEIAALALLFKNKRVKVNIDICVV